MTDRTDRVARIIEALDRHSHLLNAVVLELTLRGDVAENLAYMHRELDMKIALPWINDARQGHTYWFRHRYGVKLVEGSRDDVIAEVVTVEGDGHGFRVEDEICYQWMTESTPDEPEDADTPEKAMKAADTQLRKNGWVLL